MTPLHTATAVEIDGGLLVPYAEQGHPDGVPLVLLHVWRAALQGLIDDRPEPPGTILVPTLLCWGERDAFVPRADQDDLLARIPGAELRIYEGGGHALHWERPERFAADLVEFAALRVAA